MTKNNDSHQVAQKMEPKMLIVGEQIK